MADILLDAQSPSATPSSGQVVVYPDTVSKLLAFKNDTGRAYSLGGIRNWNTTDVVANAADTYLTGSSLAVPPHLLQAGATLRWRFAMSKTAAGTAAPVWIVRVGTAGAVGDTARLTFTSPSLQTAATDEGTVEIVAVLRNTGASGVLVGSLVMLHMDASAGVAGLSTGLAVASSVVLQVTSSGFDTTVASLIVGVSVNPGASGVWTHQLVTASMENM